MPISEPKPTSGPLILPASGPTSSGNGNIPNFFASSQFLAKAPTPPVPVPVLNFTASPTHTDRAPLVPRPVKDAENPFWDGEKDSKLSEDKSAQNILPALEKTGTQSGSTLAPVLLASSSVADAPTEALPFTFNKPTEAKQEAPNFRSTTMGELRQPFSFQAPSKPASLDDAAPSGDNVSSSIPPSFLGEAPKLLGKPVNSTSTFGQVVPPQSSPSPLPFTFGSQGPLKTEPKVDSEITPDLESTHSSTLEAPKPSFGGINGGKIFSFDQDATKPAPFSFSATSPAPVVAPKPVEEPKPVVEPKPVFPFGQPSGTTAGAAASSSVTFGFSNGGSTSDISTRQSFIFGQHDAVAPTERPVTPPRNPDNEFRMEESPTREVQQSNEANKPALALGSGFSFNTSSPIGTSLFGGGPQNLTSPLPPTSPFSFSSSSPSNPFAPKDKVDEPKAFGFGQASAMPPAPSSSFAPTDKTDEPKPFGTFGKSSAVPSTSTGFSFGQMTKASEEIPPTTGSFSFNTTPTSATASSPFSFGTPQNANPFGQATSSSAPSSPSTFTQPSSFAFGAPPSTNASFGFGSQPTSPAGGANLTLPHPTSSGGFTFGQQTQQPSSPFGAPIPLAPSTSSAALFTIGAAPAPAGVAGGPRQIRKLPNRRGGKR